MTPSPELADVLSHPRFWSDWFHLTTPAAGTYPPLDGARATFRTREVALVVRFHPRDDVAPLSRVTLEIDGTPIAYDDHSSGTRIFPHALRWLELEKVAICAAVRDRLPHPGLAVALLARFTPICDADDGDRYHALLDAALRGYNVPADMIGRIVDAVDRRPAGFHWLREEGGYRLVQFNRDQIRFSGIDVDDPDGGEGTWRSGNSQLPFPRLGKLANDAQDEARSRLSALRTPRVVTLARAVVAGDLATAPVLADAIQEAGCDNPTLIEPLIAPTHASARWVGEIFADMWQRHGLFPASPYAPMASHVHVEAPPAALAALRDANLGTWRGANMLRLYRGRTRADVERALGSARATITWYENGQWQRR